MLKTKKISLQMVVKMGGRSRPRRSIRTCNDSSAGTSDVSFSSVFFEGILIAASWAFESEALWLRLLGVIGDAPDVLLEVGSGIEEESVWGMIMLLDGYLQHLRN